MLGDLLHRQAGVRCQVLACSCMLLTLSRTVIYVTEELSSSSVISLTSMLSPPEQGCGSQLLQVHVAQNAPPERRGQVLQHRLITGCPIGEGQAQVRIHACLQPLHMTASEGHSSGIAAVLVVWPDMGLTGTAQASKAGDSGASCRW